MTPSTKRRQLVFAWRGLGVGMMLIGVVDIAFAVLIPFRGGPIWLLGLAVIGVLFTRAGWERWQHAGDLKRRGRAIEVDRLHSA